MTIEIESVEAEVELENLLIDTIEIRSQEIHTIGVGRVESYDADAQVADVQPQIRRQIVGENGDPAYEQMPVLRSVPVLHMRWGAWFIHAPLVQGDFVLLLYGERDFSSWRQTGVVSNPADHRMHHPAHAVAVPLNLYPRADAMSDTGDDALVLGLEGGSTLRVLRNGEVHAGGAFQLVRADRLQQHLNQISIALDAIMTAVVGPGATQPNYGVAAKATVDAAHPIATTKTRGE